MVVSLQPQQNNVTLLTLPIQWCHYETTITTTSQIQTLQQKPARMYITTVLPKSSQANNSKNTTKPMKHSRQMTTRRQVTSTPTHTRHTHDITQQQRSVCQGTARLGQGVTTTRTKWSFGKRVSSTHACTHARMHARSDWFHKSVNTVRYNDSRPAPTSTLLVAGRSLGFIVLCV